MKSSNQTFLLVICVLFIWCAGCDPLPENYQEQEYYEIDFPIQYNDTEIHHRRARIYPPEDLNQPAPVLFYFHGYTGSIEDSDRRRKFDEIWPEAIVVYAEGIPYNSKQTELGWRIRWPYIHYECGEWEDLAYIDIIMERLRVDFEIDEERIFATGHSSGGFFTLALMELKPDLFKGFAPFGAFSRYKVDARDVTCIDTLWTGLIPDKLEPSEIAAIPRPVLYLFGAGENFDSDKSDRLRSFTTKCNETSRYRNTLDELLIRNGCKVPGCSGDRDDYFKLFGENQYQPTSDSLPVINANLDGSHLQTIRKAVSIPSSLMGKTIRTTIISADVVIPDSIHISAQPIVSPSPRRTGAIVQTWLYGGGHSWEDFPENKADSVVVAFFKGL